jgi:hypothetical protein
MRGLPSVVQRAPQLFYGAAAIVFVVSLALAYYELSAVSGYDDTYGSNPAVRGVMLRAIFQAAVEAIHLVGTGVFVHVLLAIWRNGRGDAGRGEVE